MRSMENGAERLNGPLRVRAQGSSPESEAWLDAEHERAVSYEYWFAWLRNYEVVSRTDQ